ncbi:MAG TPA: DUF5131 family protein, partial [Pseudonocardia sp.]|nr:DUF5131 family protein [Pseudonocardia sp.]
MRRGEQPAACRRGGSRIADRGARFGSARFGFGVGAVTVSHHVRAGVDVVAAVAPTLDEAFDLTARYCTRQSRCVAGAGARASGGWDAARAGAPAGQRSHPARRGVADPRRRRLPRLAPRRRWSGRFVWPVWVRAAGEGVVVSGRSRIEWTETTWNPVTGCDRVSAGCDDCYALALARRLKAMGSGEVPARGGLANPSRPAARDPAVGIGQ